MQEHRMKNSFIKFTRQAERHLERKRTDEREAADSQGQAKEDPSFVIVDISDDDWNLVGVIIVTIQGNIIVSYVY